MKNVPHLPNPVTSGGYIVDRACIIVSLPFTDNVNFL